MSNIGWKTITKPSCIERTSEFGKEDIVDQNQNITQKEKFNSDAFLNNLRLLINQNQTQKIFEIENQMKSYGISELICVLNSQLIKYIFNEIATMSSERPQQFLASCFNIIIWATSIRDKKYSSNIERYQEFITPQFVNSIKKNLSQNTFLTQSLLVFANTFYQSSNIYDLYNSDPVNIISILTTFYQNIDDKVKCVCSLILKRILRCNFKETQNGEFIIPYFGTIIQISGYFFSSNAIFAQIKTLQMLSKFIRHYSNKMSLQNNINFNQFIISTINTFTSTANIIIFGNILHLLLSIIEVNQKGNQNYITSLFSQIPICEIIKKGLSATAPFIQSASAEIFSFNITYLSLQLNLDLIDFSFKTVENSPFEGKELMRKAIFNLFWRRDVDLKALFKLGGMDFLCDNLALFPGELIPLFNVLMIREPNIVKEVLKCKIIDVLDDIIFNNDDADENLQISAMALKEDILAE